MATLALVLVVQALNGAGWASAVRGLLVVPIALFTAATWAALLERLRGRDLDPLPLAAVAIAVLVAAELAVR